MSLLSKYTDIASKHKTVPTVPNHEPEPRFEPTVKRRGCIDTTSKARPGGEHPLVYETDNLKKARDDVNEFSEWPLQLLRKLNQNHDDIGKDLLVHSKYIQKMLQSIIASSATLNLAADPIVIPRPFTSLFHYREALKEYVKATSGEEQEILESLTGEFFQLHLAPVEKEHDEHILNGKIRFDLLWTLFSPEDDIVIQTDHYREVRRVIYCEEKKTREGVKHFAIYTWRWAYHAKRFGPCRETVTINEFAATRRIEQLDCFPIKCLRPDDREELRQIMIKRGRRWKDLLQPVHRHCKGMMWAMRGDVRAMSDLQIEGVNGRVILDHAMHVQQNGHLAKKLDGTYKYNMNTKSPVNGQPPTAITITPADTEARVAFNEAVCHNEDEYTMTDDQALLCPARVRGFSLVDKVWAFFLVDNITEIEFQEKVFEKVRLEQGLKDMITALVHPRTIESSTFDDIIPGKGKGMIMLLAGPPGAGKTLTAESVAEMTKKPLYSISMAEITNYRDVDEAKLLALFRRAARWRAVVLLDEADLFFSKRSPQEFSRTAYVTTFLRLIEYYQGIMFLTTNRHLDLDPAFKSRIHLRIKFKRPDAEMRAAIWYNFLRKLDDCKDWKESAFTRLGEDLDLNGREIKNLLRTCLLIRGYNHEPLTEELLKKVYVVNHDDTQWLKDDADSV